MEVAVLGGGHGCYAAAADAAEAGHNVRFWRRDAAAFKPVLNSQSVLLSDGRGRRDVPLGIATTDVAEAMDGADLILSPLPGIAQAGLADTIAPHLKDGQVVGYVASGAYAYHQGAAIGTCFIKANSSASISNGAYAVVVEGEVVPATVGRQPFSRPQTAI